MEGIYRRLFALARPYLQTRHNEEHTLASYRFAVKLLAVEEGVAAVVLPAVILHDVGWSAVPEDQQLKAFGPRPGIDRELRRVHEVEGAKIARRILRQAGYDADLSREIVEIIDGHDSRPRPLSDNDRLVQDADKLFRVSPRGFWIDCERFGMEPRDWHERLQRLAPLWLHTATARDLAQLELEKVRNSLPAEEEL